MRAKYKILHLHARNMFQIINQQQEVIASLPYTDYDEQTIMLQRAWKWVEELQDPEW